MKPDEVKELHFITSITNLESILQHGILSHNRAKLIPHDSCADEEVQERRRRKQVPNGGRLHSYANIYFHARNPMMFTLTRNGRDDLVVVRVAQTVLDVADTVLADGNAASEGTRFYPSPEGLTNLDSRLIFAKYWTDDDYWIGKEKKRARSAEVLVPDMIASSYIEGCYVDTAAKWSHYRSFGQLPNVTMRREIFFR